MAAEPYQSLPLVQSVPSDSEQGDDDGDEEEEEEGDEEVYPGYEEWDTVLNAAKHTARTSRKNGCCSFSNLWWYFRPDSWIVSHDKAQKDLCMALRVDNLALDQGQMLTIMQIYREYDAKLSVGASKQDSFINVNIVAGTFSVAVPVIIPYSQTYKNYVCYGFKGCLHEVIGTNSTGTGTPTNVRTGTPILNVGTCLAILGVVCSLIATVLNAFQKSSKLKETSEADIQEAEETEKELNLFLAFTGLYAVGLEDFDDETGQSGVDKAYQLLIENYQEIRTNSFDAMKASLASASPSPGPKAKAAPDPKAKTEAAPKKKGKA